MRAFIAKSLLVAVGIGIAGLILGWFDFSTSVHDHEIDPTALNDSEKSTKEHDAFQQRADIRFKAMDLNLEELKAKAKNGRAVTRDNMTQMIDDLNAKTEAARKELRDLKTATSEGWNALKTRLDASLNELEKGFEKAFSRFMSESTRSAGERQPTS